MSPADLIAETAASLSAPVSAPHPGADLHCARNRRPESPRSKARIDQRVAADAAHRLGTLAILTGISVVGMTLAQNALQPELAAAHRAPLFQLSALLLVLASLGLAALERCGLARAQTLLDLGLAFEVAGAFVIATMENSLPWANSPVRGSSTVAVWIAVCILVIPNRLAKSLAAALGSVAMIPIAHLVCSHALGYPALSWERLLSYMLSAPLVAGWTLFISTRAYRMQHDVTRLEALGSYRLESLLGKGGMGEVWRARHHMLRRDAAVKLVLPDLLARAGAAEMRRIHERFEREAQAIASLRSPHTVALYDFGIADNGSLYYVMELLEGLDLQRLVERHGPQPPGRVISLLRQACDSLEEAHGLGMVHRDVKPTNLFVCRMGTQVDVVKVLDFGLVKAAVEPGESLASMHRETSGTPAFMSPEQVYGEADVDARADVYGLGCVAYYLLTGTLVFDEATAVATALAHVGKDPAPPSRRTEVPIPASLERVVMACLAKKRDDRPGSISELASMFDNCTDVAAWTRADARQWWDIHYPPRAQRVTA
jgi:serine/threonine-protein kinase